VAEAKDRLPSVVRETGTSPVEITRRGRPVAVLLSLEDFERLQRGRESFGAAYDRFRATADLSSAGIDPGTFEALRERSPGRDV
jgi:prevent-host-death family protein